MILSWRTNKNIFITRECIRSFHLIGWFSIRWLWQIKFRIWLIHGCNWPIQFNDDLILHIVPKFSSDCGHRSVYFRLATVCLFCPDCCWPVMADILSAMRIFHAYRLREPGHTLGYCKQIHTFLGASCIIDTSWLRGWRTTDITE